MKQTSIDLGHVTSWFTGLGAKEQDEVLGALRLFALDPGKAPFVNRSRGKPIYTASLRAGDKLFRVDFVIDPVMEKVGVSSVIVTKAIRIF